MKFKYYFTLILVIVILFSLTNVAASENMTNEMSGLDNTLSADVSSIDEDLDLEISGSHEIADKQTSANDNVEDAVDLSVKINVKNVYNGNKFNTAGSEIPWTITASVRNGTAHNVKILEKMSGGMEYISSDSSIGVFDPETGIWDIGDLTSDNNATLKILTRLKVNGMHLLTANATTSSKDINTQNNFGRVSISNGSTAGGSNDTDTSETDHSHDNPHTQSTDPTDDIRITQNGTKKNPNPNFESNHTSDRNKDSNSNATHASNGNKDSAQNSENGAQSTLPSTISKSILNNNKDQSNDLLDTFAKVIPPYDYTRIPIIIFSAFLALLIAIVGYDKIKS